MTQPPNQQFDPNQVPGDSLQDQAMHQQYLAQQQFEAEQAQPKKKKKNPIIQGLGILVTVALLGFGAWQLWSNFASDQALQAGKCIVVSGEANNADHKEVDCADQSQFSYKVYEIVDSELQCPANTNSYTITSKGRYGKTTTEKVACLAMNLHVGVCYTENVGNVLEPLSVDASCGAGSFKLDSEIQSENAECPEPTIAFPMPASTLCFSENS